MISVIGAGVLLMSVCLLCARRIEAVLPLCAVQSLFASVVLGAAGEATAAIAVLALLLNGIAVPLAMRRVAMPSAFAARIGDRMTWPLALALIVMAGAWLANIGTGETLALGTSVVLLGLLMVARDPRARVVGLLSAQNGLLLVASAVPDLPLPAALVVAIPLVPVLALADAWLHQ